ncbi:hypothetical protein VTI74DRAFT_11688 [Chaetomium olivicolor]
MTGLGKETGERLKDNQTLSDLRELETDWVNLMLMPRLKPEWVPAAKNAIMRVGELSFPGMFNWDERIVIVDMIDRPVIFTIGPAFRYAG